MITKPLPYSTKGDLTTGSVRGHVIRLTIPMIWGLMAIISLHLVDTYFISMLGTEKLAGISFTFPVTMAITHLIFGLNVAMSSVVSRMIGEKRPDAARRIILHCLMIATGTSFVISLLCYIHLEQLFSLLGADETMMPIIRDYMPLWLAGSVIAAIPINGNSAIRALGDAFTPAMIMTIMALINVILDPILIFGLLGAPAMGVKGAVLATFIAYVFCMIVGLYVLVIKKDLLPRDGWKINWHMDKFKNSAGRLVVIALPVGIASIIVPVTNAIIIAVLATYGANAVAAFGIVSRVESFALILVMALSIGMSPIIGQNWGAKKYLRVHETINTAISFNFAWSAFVAIIMGVFARQIAGAFSNDPAVISYATFFFWIVPFSYAFANLVFAWSSAYNAMGMPKKSFMMTVVKSLLMTIPAIFIGKWLYDVNGIFIAIASVNVLAGVLFHMMSWRICLKYEDGIKQ